MRKPGKLAFSQTLQCLRQYVRRIWAEHRSIRKIESAAGINRPLPFNGHSTSPKLADYFSISSRLNMPPAGGFM